MSAHSDRSLIFAVLALKMDLVSREALVGGVTAWLDRREVSLGQVLQERGELSEEARRAVEALVEGHLGRPGDAREGLADSAGPAPSGDRERVGGATAEHSPGAPAEATTDLAWSASAAAFEPSAYPATLRYRQLDLHAKGGLGEVYLARDEELMREVALKEIQPRHAGHASSRVRFVREALITGGLEHPGVVPVYGMGAYADGRPFYAMRFIRGETLQDAIRRFHDADSGERDPSERELSLRSLLGRFVAVCNAVGYAHSRGVIHRDLKPANVMLGDYGETLVVDWGLAKALGQPEEGADERLMTATGGGPTQTAVGSAVGTPGFMPPEQARGEHDRVGQGSDVFALGATLYNLLTGRPPYVGSQALALAAEGEVGPARGVNPRVPAALEAVCQKAMAARPEGRYGTARELAGEVERWLADEPVTAMPEPRREKVRRWAKRNRPLVTAGAALLIAGVIGLGVGLGVVRAEQARTASERDRANDAEQLATARLGVAEKNLARALKAETDLNASLKQSEENLNLARENLKLAKKAVDETFGIAKDHPLLRGGPDISKERAELQRVLLEKSLPFYQNFRVQRSGDVATLDEETKQLFQLSFIHTVLGLAGKPEALEGARKAEHLTRQLVKAHPGVALYQARLAAVLINRSNLERAQGRLKEAIKCSEEAVQVWRALSKAEPGSSETKLQLANAVNNLGRYQSQVGRREEAIKCHAEAIRLYRDVVKERPDRSVDRAQLASALSSQGNVLQDLNRRAEARTSYLEAARLRRALVEELPRELGPKDDLARTLGNLGRLYLAARQPAEAAQCYEEAAGLYRAVSEGRKGEPSPPLSLARTLTKLADAQARLGRAGPALESRAAAVQAFRQAVAAEPKVRFELFEALVALGMTQRGAGRQQGAVKSLSEAIEQLRELIKSTPADVVFPFYLTGVILARGEILSSLRKHAAAREDFAEALKVLARLKLNKAHPNRDDMPSVEFRGHLGRANALEGLGRHREALADWERALGLAPLTMRGMLRVYRASCLARAGDHDRAAAEAASLAQSPGLPPQAAFEIACVLSVSAAGAARGASRPLPLCERQAEERARRAVALLGRAARAGLFRSPGQLERLDEDRELAFVRGREDYKRLRAGISPGGR